MELENKESVLFVDDEPAILSSLKRLFRKSGFNCYFAESGEEGLKVLEQQPIDLIVSDMRMPKMSGAEFLSIARSKWPDTVRILLTGHSDIGATIEALNKGGIYRYISKPWNDQELEEAIDQSLRLRRLEREREEWLKLTQTQNEKLQSFNTELEARVLTRTQEIQQTADMLDMAYEELKQSSDMFIKVFSTIISSRFNSQRINASMMADLAKKIAQKVNLPKDEINHIYYACLLHELGKTGLPDSILAVPESSLDSENTEIYRQYPALGEMILMGVDQLALTSKIIGSHMERFDGQGFPNGLKGSAIPRGARLLRVVRDFIGLQMGVLERESMSNDEAFKYIKSHSAKIYDPGVVKVLGLFQSDFVVSSVSSGERHIDVLALKPGMKVARDVTNANGILLISKDFLLTNPIINRFMSIERLERKKLKVYVYLDGEGK
ncbi:HD domain-containing phosphohydrolase [Alkalimarinus alittae]|uniref:Response regulator n=1 Tax=Alkalimarinus alittae TaxID=2961619 RepID=A0ABY6N5K9_9ALTE|nr:HD domain-containing phosphohydrolase [Alkalimarinus alittae]UZE97403.1 response regulator [Alkalimarinus alittae]